MSDFERRSTVALSRLLAAGVALTACLTWNEARAAEPAGQTAPRPEAGRSQQAGQALKVGLNEDGDMTIRRGNVALVLAYGGGESSEPVRRTMQPVKSDSSFGGISWKVALVF